MKKLYVSSLFFLSVSVTMAVTCSCSPDSQPEIPVEMPSTPSDNLGTGSDNNTPGTTPSDPTTQQYAKQGSMQASSELVGKDYTEIHSEVLFNNVLYSNTIGSMIDSIGAKHIKWTFIMEGCPYGAITIE